MDGGRGGDAADSLFCYVRFDHEAVSFFEIQSDDIAFAACLTLTHGTLQSMRYTDVVAVHPLLCCKRNTPFVERTNTVSFDP